ncbi:MAG TPA: DUF2834 domain-containing protein [Thermoanaerobaculia bacterium]|jgi:hypothetical protein
MRGVYLFLSAAGAVVSLLLLVPFVAAHDVREVLAALVVNRVAAAFGADVVLSAVSVMLFALREQKRAVLVIAATLLFGVSCGLPLLLALREDH